MRVTSIAVAVAMGLLTTVSYAKTKAERQEAKAERVEKKAERQERKADRKAEQNDHKGMGRFDKNHDGKMSFSEHMAKYNSQPSWMHAPDFKAMGIKMGNVKATSVSADEASVLHVDPDNSGPGSAAGNHNGAASDH
jgi:hypothetical protein